MRITIRQSFHAVFYSPLYAAQELGAFAEEGLDVHLSTSTTPVDSYKDLVDGEVDIKWGGHIRVLLGFDRDPDCGLVLFCEVVGRNPFYIVGGSPRPDFALHHLAGLKLAPVGEVPTPWLCLQDDLRRAGLDPQSLDTVTGRTMADNASALRSGEVDVIQLSEPYVESLLREGAGHIWYAGAARGRTAYTGFFTTLGVLEAKHDLLLGVTRAVYRTQRWMGAHSGAEIADVVQGSFPEVDADVLAAAIGRYRALGVWGDDPLPSEEGFQRLKGALLSGRAIATDVPFEACVDRSLVEQVVAEIPSTL